MYFLNWSSGGKTCVLQIKLNAKGLEEEIPEALTGEDCLVDNRSENDIERAPGPSKRARKTVRALTEARILHI